MIATASARLLRAILDDPADDTARLAYSDALEEEGQWERAEFIRVQVEISRTQNYPGERYCDAQGALLLRGTKDCKRCRPCLLRRRERELIRGYAWKWLRDGLPPFVRGEFRRWTHAATTIRSKRDKDWMLTFRRGFVEHVTCTAEAWERHGPAVVLAQPIREVRLVGAEPGTIGDGRHYWFDQMRSDPRFTLAAHHLPNWLFEALGGGAGEADGFSYRTYIIREAALDALSRACVAYGRHLAGLPALD